MSLCKYKNALGIPNKGIHSYRFMGVAIMDVIMTILAAYLISIFRNLKPTMINQISQSELPIRPAKSTTGKLGITVAKSSV